MMKDHLAKTIVTLIIDSSNHDYSLIIAQLKKENISCKLFDTSAHLLHYITENEFDLVISELILEDMEGIELCRQIREKLIDLPFVFYTNKQDDFTQIVALNSGADDYILKTTKPNVVVARITSLLRKARMAQLNIAKNNSTFSIDRERYLVMKEGNEISLPRKEFELLSLLHSSPKKVFSRKEISRIIWGEESLFKNRTIDVHIRKLREKLGERYIKTIKGVGYSFDL